MNFRLFPLSLCMAFCTIIVMSQEESSTLHMQTFSASKEVTQNSITDKTAFSNSHSTLLAALKSSELSDLLAYNGQFTVFAPSNTAFNKLSKLTVERLLDPLNKKALKSILSYHIIAGKLSASAILKAMCRGNGSASFTTILGEKITATMNGIDIVLTDMAGNNATIVLADFNRCNGVIHEIDTVFLPLKL